LRFTARHGGQASRNYFAYRGDLRRALALGKFLVTSGYVVNYDWTAPIWQQGSSFPEGMLANDDNDDVDAFADCKIPRFDSAIAYSYESKVCVSPELYIWISRSDTLMQAAQAIHVLNRSDEPDQSYARRSPAVAFPIGWDPRSSNRTHATPRFAARELEQTFRTLGFGIPVCAHYVCAGGVASGVRTFQFGALETLLGYGHGDATSQSYADALARIALEVQIAGAGRFDVAGVSYLRPAYVGAFLTNWNRTLDFSSMRPGLTGILGIAIGAKEMKPEYVGIVPSNVEATTTAYAFLKLYRCLRFNVGCQRPDDRAARAPLDHSLQPVGA
jgi:hypothetical protein